VVGISNVTLKVSDTKSSWTRKPRAVGAVGNTQYNVRIRPIERLA
jgi:hypothetical protein